VAKTWQNVSQRPNRNKLRGDIFSHFETQELVELSEFGHKGAHEKSVRAEQRLRR
jgi:hypothetical protein